MKENGMRTQATNRGRGAYGRTEEEEKEEGERVEWTFALIVERG